MKVANAAEAPTLGPGDDEMVVPPLASVVVDFEECCYQGYRDLDLLAVAGRSRQGDRPKNVLSR